MSGASSRVESGKTPRRRARGWALEARDAEWLRLHRQGWTVPEIAKTSKSNCRLVEKGLARARASEASHLEEADPERSSRIRDNGEGAPIPWWLELVPLFPIGSFTPASKCRHRGPIQAGSLDCCMVCSASGVDDHPALKRDSRTDPRPESGSGSVREPRKRG